MDNFALIQTGVETRHLLKAINSEPELWGTGDIRVSKTEPQHIFLRINDNVPEGTPAVAVEFLETPSFWALQEFRPIIFNTFSKFYGVRLGGVMIAKMPPHSQIPEHSDTGPCAYYYDARIHIVLQATNVDFHCGNEVVQMNTGEMWWFDLNKPHSLVNNSDTDRIHLIMDIKSMFGRDSLVKLFKDNCLYARS